MRLLFNVGRRNGASISSLATANGRYTRLVKDQPVLLPMLVKACSSPEAGRTSAKDENVDLRYRSRGPTHNIGTGADDGGKLSNLMHLRSIDQW